jgi:hypothetical protein
MADGNLDLEDGISKVKLKKKKKHRETAGREVLSALSEWSSVPTNVI